MASSEASAAKGEWTGTTELRTDQNETFSVHIKPEFMLSERPSSLPPLPEPSIIDDQEGQSDKQNRSSKRGQNKKRPRDAKLPFEEKLCFSILRGEECPYGAEKCRYTHDMKRILATRPADLTQVEGGCPRYNVTGFCEYGIMCRLGSSHVNLSTGENLRDEDKVTPPPVMNVLSKEVQSQLRKKRYPFKCKRHFEKDDNKVPQTAAETDTSKTNGSMQETATDYSPLPTKRKLIDFSNKVYVAPLTTVGNLPFRRIMKRFGADITCGEMALASNLLEGKPSEWALLKRHPEEDVFGVQIAAGFADQFTRVCEILEAQTTVDFVDLNMGCPLDMVCDKGAGSALMLREKKLKLCLQGVTNTLSCPVTLKMRTGWSDGKPIAHRLVSKIQSWGLDGIAAVMIHGRSRLQRYSNLADWDYISSVATNQSSEFPRIPVIGNGDIVSYKDYEEKVSREGVSTSAMLARGALIKPWLPTEIKEQRHWDISASERLDILKDFVRFGLEHWGSDQQGVNNTRRFLLEWLSFLHRYIPVGMLERGCTYAMNHRRPNHMCGRSDLETLMLSNHARDWIRIAELLLGPVPQGFRFEPKHKASG